MEFDYDTGISPHHARKVFKYALAATADDDIHKTYSEQLKKKTTKIKSVNENIGFEVTEILFPTQEILDFYAQPDATGLKPVGKIRAKTWIVPTAAGEDLTEEEEEALGAKTPDTKHYEFWVENDILPHCVVGMKVEATVTELSFGVSYFDALSGVHCSFYQLLPNELMAGWRAPEKEWLPMKEKTRRDAKFEDIPGEVGEEGEVLGESALPGEKLPEHTENGINDAGDDSRRTDEKRTHEIKSDGNQNTHGQIDAMEFSDAAVTVRETGERLIQVPINAEKIVEKTFDVEPRYDK